MLSDKPLLSVLVPAYNVGSYIESCLRSVLLQTYSSIEVLVCDDGSTDNTWAKIIQFADPRLRVFQNPQNLGKNLTTSFLFEQSKGEYITVHDADDISAPSRLENQMNFLLKNRDYAMCGTNFISFLSNGKVISKSSLTTNDAAIKELIKRESQFHGPTVVFRKDVVPIVGGLYRYFTRAEDIDFTMRVTERFKVCNLPGHDYFYRHQALSLTNNIHGYDIERLAHAKLLIYLSEERLRNNGIDSLMRGDMAKVNALVSEFKKEYKNDPEIALRRGVFRLLNMHMYSNAIKLSWIAMMRKQSLLNFKCFVYALIQSLKGRYRLWLNHERTDFSFLG